MATTLKEGQLIITGRLGYPKLFRPEGIKGDPTSKPRYGCQIMVPKTDTKAKKKLDDEIERLSKLHFKGKVPKSKDLFVKDGDGEDGDENTKGFWLVSANRAESQGRPQIVDRDGRTALHEADGKPYAGCWANFLIGVYVPKGWGKICASIEVVQFVRDGEPFSGGRVDVDAVMPEPPDEDMAEFQV